MIRLNQKLTNLNLQMRNYRHFVTSTSLLKSKENLDIRSEDKQESVRMKQFHEKLKLQPVPRIGPRERFVELVLVETDSDTGELIANSEKNPTKWGDWQNGGRVTDF